MKFFILGLFIIVTIAILSDANADDPHGVVIQQGSPSIYYSTSQAMSLAASEINPTLLSSKWQVGIGFGSHNNETAVAAGIAKRVNKNLLFSGKIANQGGDIGTSIGLNFKF